MTPEFIARQFSRPSGLTGRFMGFLMNRRNARMNLFAVEQLELEASDRALEIGFGGGSTLPALLAGASYVAGVDPSEDVVNLARGRFAKSVEEDRAEFRVGAVEALPYQAGSFTKICTVNTVYFWQGLERGAAEMYRVLAPGGRVAVGFLPKQWMDPMGLPATVFTAHTAEDVARALMTAGFRNVRTQLPKSPAKWNLLLAERARKS
jgi:arsenite methyltransferase